MHTEVQDQRAAGYAEAALQRLHQHALVISGQFQKMLRKLNKQKSDLKGKDCLVKQNTDKLKMTWPKEDREGSAALGRV